MKLLAVDTSGPVCGTAVMDGERVLSEYTAQNRNTHSASLMLMVERCLESAGETLEGMDALAVVTGPGSFTGVRIGVATVKGMAHGSGKPCIPVDALEALAFGSGRWEEEKLLCPIQDARAGQIYGAFFSAGKRLTENRPMKLEEYLEEAKRLHPGPWVFNGDGMTVHRDSIRRLMGDGAVFAEAPFAYLRPSAAGTLAQQKGGLIPYTELKETYLRPPNAEKNRKLLEAMRHE